MIRKSILVVVGVVLVSLTVSTKAAARDVRLAAGNPGRVILMDPHDLIRVAGRYGLTIRRLKISAEEKARLAKLASKGCGCGVPDELDGFGSCFSNCLSSWHINQSTILGCGGVCVAAGNGNLVGVALCAGCLGIGEWIVAGCAMSCAWHSGGGGRGDVLGKNLKHRASPSGSAQAKTFKSRTANVRI
jgi:hypothetical protein